MSTPKEPVNHKQVVFPEWAPEELCRAYPLLYRNKTPHMYDSTHTLLTLITHQKMERAWNIIHKYTKNQAHYASLVWSCVCRAIIVSNRHIGRPAEDDKLRLAINSGKKFINLCNELHLDLPLEFFNSLDTPINTEGYAQLIANMEMFYAMELYLGKTKEPLTSTFGGEHLLDGARSTLQLAEQLQSHLYEMKKIYNQPLSKKAIVKSFYKELGKNFKERFDTRMPTAVAIITEVFFNQKVSPNTTRSQNKNNR